MKYIATSNRLAIAVVMVAMFTALAVVTERWQVSAATFTVTNTDDNGGINPAPNAGTGTLRQAIVDANAASGADTIDFAPGVTGTITLILALPQITGDVTINGPGAGLLTVSGFGTKQVFVITPGATASVSGLTISNGVGALGGGIRNDGTLAVSNSTFSNNLSPFGGGIYNTGTLTVTSSTFSTNIASGSGGVIYNTGTANVTGSTISGNTAPVFGGGIDNNAGMLTVTDSTFSSNSAGSGGGINNNAGMLTVTGSTFSSNSASFGGGIRNTSGGTLIITNSTFSSNSAVGTDGGGIYNEGTVTVTNGTFNLNSAPNRFGGGIYNGSGTLTVTGSTFAGNSADFGGGILNTFDGTLIITNSTFSGNSAAVWGGGIFHVSGTLTVTSSTFFGNSADSGGGIINGGSATFKNSIIANSTAGGNCAGDVAITAVGVNFSTDNTCGAGFTQVTVLQLNLGPLQDNGGPTLTHALLAGSVAIDAVMDCTDLSATPVPVNTDQRGVMRPTDGDGDGTALCDVGAFEAAACISGDTLPPMIDCPDNVTAVAAQTCPISSSATVNFSAPTVSDNCPGMVTTVCTPPSGSIFSVGTTTVTCTATDAAGNTATCSFTVTVFSGCLQDDSNPVNVVLFNAATGEYRFCCNGTVFTGVGTILVKGCIVTVQHYPADRRVLIKFDGGTSTGTASLQSPPGTIRCTITDRNTRNNTCACQAMTQ